MRAFSSGKTVGHVYRPLTFTNYPDKLPLHARASDGEGIYYTYQPDPWGPATCVVRTCSVRVYFRLLMTLAHILSILARAQRAISGCCHRVMRVHSRTRGGDAHTGKRSVRRRKAASSLRPHLAATPTLWCVWTDQSDDLVVCRLYIL